MPDATLLRARRLVGLLALAGILLVLLAVAHRSARPLGSSDIFWQVRTGEIALAGGRIPDRDVFSYTVPGAAWNNHEWLFEVLAALLHRAAGWGGFRSGTVALMLAVAAGLAAAVGRRGGAPAAFLVVALFCALAGYKMAPVPQGLSMALFFAALGLFRGRALAVSPRRWVALVLVMLLWGNLTAESVMFLPFLLLDQGALRLARARGRGPALPSPARHLLLCAAACAAPLVNPPQSSVLEYVLAGTAANRVVNVEFAPIWAPAWTVLPAVKAGGLALMALFVAWAAVTLGRSADRGAALREVGPGLLAVALAGAFERNLWLLVLPAARLALAAVAWAGARPRRVIVDLVLLLAAAAVFSAFEAAYRWTPLAALRDLSSPAYRAHHIDEREVPTACVDPLAGVPGVGRVFTLRMWASYVIWRLPGARVFIDGRNREYPAITQQMADHAWEGGPVTRAILDASGTDAVVALPGWGDLPGVRGGPWRVAARGENCELYLRGAAR
jgi:hypothetical protein